MANPLDELKRKNDEYHAAANEVMEANVEAFGVSVEEMMEIKAKFGAYHNNIFQLMDKAQGLLILYFGSEEEKQAYRDKHKTANP